MKQLSALRLPHSGFDKRILFEQILGLIFLQQIGAKKHGFHFTHDISNAFYMKTICIDLIIDICLQGTN